MLLSRLKVAFDAGLTASNLLDRMAFYAPDQQVFRFDDPGLEPYGVTGQALSIKEVRAVVNQMAHVMSAHGVGRFDRVAIWKSNSLDYFLISMAAIRLGGITVPINGGMAPRDLVAYLARIGPRALCLDRQALDRLHAAGVAPSSLAPRLFITDAAGAPPQGTIDFAGGVRAASADGDGASIPHDAHVMICHTSGTTGFPKGVLHCSESLTWAVRGQLRIQPVTHRNVALMAAPMNHHIALSGCMTNVAGGLPVCIAVESDPDYLMRMIERHKVNIFFAFPHTYLAMYRAGPSRYDLSSMRMWMSGADAMHEVHIREFTRYGAFLSVAGKAVLGSLFMELLGTSEVGIVALMKISQGGTKRYARCVGKRTPISPKVKVADADGRELPAGQVGRLMVKGPTVFKGYWNEHHRLHGVVIDGWWWTGDLARRDSKGRFYQLDRDSDCIRTNAGPIYTLPIEEELLKHPDVHEAVVIGIPAEDGGQKPMIVLQAKEGRNDFDASKAQGWIARHVALCRPCTDVVVVREDSDLPRGLTGKILKRVVRDRHTPQASQPAASPQNECQMLETTS